MLRQFDYLLGEIRQKHKHTVVEWNSLIHTALIEINESISKKEIIFESETTLDFSEYQAYMQRLGKWPEVTNTQRKITRQG